jgi:hypothetical protein
VGVRRLRGRHIAISGKVVLTACYEVVMAVASAMCASTSPHLISCCAEPLHRQETLFEYP